jgi:hypothetical protein
MAVGQVGFKDQRKVGITRVYSVLAVTNWSKGQAGTC